MDVGYIVRPGATNEELRYSLRTLVNLPHDRVFIAGTIPPFIRNVVEIPRAQGSRRKFQNAAVNLYALCESDISEDFALFNDDFFVMKPLDTIPVHHRGPMAEVQARLARRLGSGSAYIQGMEHTRVFMEENYGITDAMSYGLHIPMMVNKTVLRTILLATGITNPMGRANFHVRTIYGNVAQVGGSRIPDVKVATTTGFSNYKIGGPFVSTSDRSFASGQIGRHIRPLFPDQSPYEQQSLKRRR